MQRFECDAVLFDLDGTLVDSTPNVEYHWRLWTAKHVLDAESILKISHGRPTVDTMRIVAPHLDADSEAQQLDASQAIHLDGVVCALGAHELVTAMPPTGWAIVTSGNWAIATHRLQHVNLPIPEVLITTDVINHYKPHPEGYLKAAEQLGVDPEQCLVIEDAPVGIEAAHAAGMKVIAVASTYLSTDLTAADACVLALTDLTIAPMPTPATGHPRFEVLITNG